VTHVKPDGDGLGCMAALRLWLLAEGKIAAIIVPTPPPAKYAFLDPGGAVQVAGVDVNPGSIEPPDLVCVVDTGTRQQLGTMRGFVEGCGAPVLVVDHHRTQDPIADWLLVDPEAAACAMIVHRLLLEAGAEMTAEMAGYLLTGLATDTDWFHLPNTGPEALRLAASLVEAGARPSEIHQRLYANAELSKVRLLGLALGTIRPALGGRAMVMRLTRDLFHEAGVTESNTEDLINECMKIRGAEAAVMLVEGEDGQIHVSLRSRPGVNILQVAERFGGGGHVRAAGLRLAGSLDEAEAKVLEAVRAALSAAGPPREPQAGPEEDGSA